MVCKSNFFTVSFYLPTWQAFIYFYYKTKSLKLQVLHILKFQLCAVIVSALTYTFACRGRRPRAGAFAGGAVCSASAGWGRALLGKIIFRSSRSSARARRGALGARGWLWACDRALWAGHLGEPCCVLARCLRWGQSVSPWTLQTVQFAVVQRHMGVLKCQEVAEEVDAAVRTVPALVVTAGGTDITPACSVGRWAAGRAAGAQLLCSLHSTHID